MAQSPSPDPQPILARYGAARNRRANWESLWQECADFALPQTGRRSAIPGERRGERLFDGTAPDAVEQLAASLLAQLTPPWSRWFGLAPGPDLDEGERAALAPVLERAARTIQAHFDRSNFAVEMHQCWLELVAFGTASLLFEEASPGEMSCFRFAAIPLEEAAFEEGADGRLTEQIGAVTKAIADMEADGREEAHELRQIIALLSEKTGKPDTRGAYPITYAALYGTNLRQAGRFRLELFADAAWTDRIFDTRDGDLDRRVIPSLYDWRQLRWGAPNLFRGDLPPEDYSLYPSNVHVAVPLCRPQSWRWTLIDTGYLPDGTDAGYLEIGHVWFSDSLQFQINYAYGGHDGWNPTDEVTRTPGGGVLVEPGTGYRSAEIPLEYVRRGDTDKLFDLSARVGFHKPVVWLPNVDSAADLFRYGFIGQRRDAHRRTWKHYGLDGSTLQIEEITT